MARRLGGDLNDGDLIRPILESRSPFWLVRDFWVELFSSLRESEIEVDRLIERYKGLLLENLKYYRSKGINMPYEQDNRQPEEYIYDVVESWFIEEIVARWIKSNLLHTFPDVKLEVRFSGGDRNRQFVFEKKRGDETTTEPDLAILAPKGIFFVELQNSRRGRREIYDIKSSKVRRIRHRHGMLLFSLLPSESSFFFVPNDQFHLMKKRTNISWGKKLTYFVSQEQLQNNGWGYYSFEEGLPALFVDLFVALGRKPE